MIKSHVFSVLSIAIKHHAHDDTECKDMENSSIIQFHFNCYFDWPGVCEI